MRTKSESRAIVFSTDVVLGDVIVDWLKNIADLKGTRRETLGLHENGGEVELAVVCAGDASFNEGSDRMGALRASLRSVISSELKQIIVVSSGAIYGPDHHLSGFVAEDTRRRPAISNREADWWSEFEETVNQELISVTEAKLTVLRTPFILGGDDSEFMSRVINRRRLIRYVGFNPPLQFVSVTGLAKAIGYAAQRRISGIYHVAPDDVIPLRSFLKSAGIRSIGVPRLLQRFLRPILFRFIDGVKTTDEIDYLRYPWTLSGEKFSQITGWRQSNRDALAETGTRVPESWPDFDRFGAEEAFFAKQGKLSFRFAEQAYWRIESRGFENFPGQGGAIIVGPHRGFMPLDAVMIFHLIYQNAGRIPRFLTHPTLLKFPFQCPFFQRMACVIACQKNAERVLESGELLGVYPEGIQGAFKMFRDVYTFGKFGRSDYARWALKYNVPVVPFAIVGSAEIFPILGKIKWRWLKKYLEWPFFPITPTFPIIPVPLPTKWHVDFLAPIYPSEVRAKAEELGKDPVVVFVKLVRDAVEKATREMLAKRRSIFWGRIWESDG